MHFLQWAHDTAVGNLVRDVSWLFTTGLVIHFTGICLLMGTMFVVDMRLLGFAKQIPISAVLKLLPLALIAFAMNLITGMMFFTYDPVAYWRNPAFKVKLALLLLAGLNALYFTIAEYRKVASHDEETVALTTRIAAGLSLALWMGVIVAGRLIVAYQGSLDSGA